MSSALLDSLNLDMEVVNNVFNSVLSWLTELNMENSLMAFCDQIAEAMQRENPFVPCIHIPSRYEDYVFDSPTNKMIYMIYAEAKKAIIAEYPNAVISFRVDGYNSKFSVDDETYDKAYKERFKDE